MANPPSHIGPPAAWYDDPDDPTSYRYWNGTSWTAHRSPRTLDASAVEAASVASSMPVDDPGSAVAVPVARSASPGWSPARLLAAFGGGAVVVGSFGPWAVVSSSYLTVDITGTEGDGMYTLVGGAVVVLAAYARRYLLGIVVGFLTAWALLVDLFEVADLAGDDGLATTSIGWGLALAAAGAVVAVVASVVERRRERAHAAAEVSAT